VTNITFIFETSPNTKPKEKEVGGTWHTMSPPSEKVGGTRPPCPPPNCAHTCDTAVDHKLCTNQIRTQTASLPPSLTINSLN